ncbi:MAG TPA: tetratricopeptide repeat protein [Bacteroidia bacterium]
MRSIVIIIILNFILVSCGSGNTPETKEEVKAIADTAGKTPDNSKAGLLKQIKQLEDTLFTSETMDRKLGNRAIALYQEYHKYYFQDTACADFLFKAAEIADNMGFPQKAIDLYRDCYEYYPQSSLAPFCLFRIGNIYQFTINDYVEAKLAYNDCKKEYPNSPVAKDAENLLNNVAKGDLQMVREFEKKNKK